MGSQEVKACKKGVKAKGDEVQDRLGKGLLVGIGKVKKTGTWKEPGIGAENPMV